MQMFPQCQHLYVPIASLNFISKLLGSGTIAAVLVSAPIVYQSGMIMIIVELFV